MYLGSLFVTFVVLLQYDQVIGQRHISGSTTAAELWNPFTWFYPYAIATAEGYRDYYKKAQEATNELYKQIYATNAFPWITGNWGGASTPSPTSTSEASTSSTSGGSTTSSAQTESTTSSTQTESTTSSTQTESTTPSTEETGSDVNTEA